MKRSFALVVLVIAVAATLMSGCTAKRPVTMTMNTPTDKVYAAAVGKDANASLQFDLVLRNIHVYPEDNGTTGAVVLANEVKIDLLDILAGKEVQVLATTIPEGTYYDLTITFSEVYAKGSLDIFGMLVSANVDAHLNYGNGISVRYDNTQLVVDKDGAKLVWTCDIAMLMELSLANNSTTIVAKGSITIQ